MEVGAAADTIITTVIRRPPKADSMLRLLEESGTVNLRAQDVQDTRFH